MRTQKSRSCLRIKGKMFVKIWIDGQLQSGDPMTTWSNTFNIIMYQNYYLRNIALAKDRFGLIENNRNQQLYVSGDDQVFRGSIILAQQVYAAFLKYESPDRERVKLARYADPINYRTDGYFQFISKVICTKDGVHIFREPFKIITGSHYYAGDLESFAQNPAEHSFVVGQSLLQQVLGSTLFEPLAYARLRVG